MGNPPNTRVKLAKSSTSLMSTYDPAKPLDWYKPDYEIIEIPSGLVLQHLLHNSSYDEVRLTGYWNYNKFYVSFSYDQYNIDITTKFLAKYLASQTADYLSLESNQFEHMLKVLETLMAVVANSNGEMSVSASNISADAMTVSKYEQDEPAVEKFDVEAYSKALPGMNHVVNAQDIQDTCGCAMMGRTLWSYIQHLNDSDRWSRERIADWLDELHDSGKINLEFSPWEDNNDNED